VGALSLKTHAGIWFFLLLLPACGGNRSTEVACDRNGAVLDEGLQIRDIRCGSGKAAERGAIASVRYAASLETGTIFDSNRSDEPFTFRLGSGQVVEGWDRGLLGMRVGGTRELVVPPALAYDDAGLYPDVGPGETVTFEVELVAIRSPED
jgi:FKBP-type peptidyl-prolyl cis-trans isomerase